MGILKRDIEAKKDEGLPLHIKYRPSQLDEVVGQDAVVNSLRRLLHARNVPHAFLFTGPSGTGKTTLARIVASALLVDALGVMELDAASSSGIENMRNVMDVARYRSMAGAGRKFLIIDECHSLSKAAWQSMLKMVEEPPAHVYWALCTTEAEKVPETIRTRCTCYNLRLVDDDEIVSVLERVNKEERLRVPSEVLGLVARQAAGSVRKALVFLSQVAGVEDKKEALRLLETGVGEEEQAIQLARMVCTGKGFNWPAAQRIVAGLEGESPEGVRLLIVNYAASMLKESKNPEPLLAVLDAFRTQCNASEKWAPIYLALGSLLFS